MTKRSTPILLKFIPHGLNENIYFPITKEYSKYNEFLAFKNNLLKKAVLKEK